MEKQVVTVKEVQEILGVSRKTVDRMLEKGILPFVRIERLRLIPRVAIDNFINGK